MFSIDLMLGNDKIRFEFEEEVELDPRAMHYGFI
jgi:hypothetical protein